jgi:hypothetical protein
VVEAELSGERVAAGVEADASSCTWSLTWPPGGVQGHPGMAGSGVLGHVGQGFLGDPVQDRLLGRGQADGRLAWTVQATPVWCWNTVA